MNKNKIKVVALTAVMFAAIFAPLSYGRRGGGRGRGGGMRGGRGGMRGGRGMGRGRGGFRGGRSFARRGGWGRGRGRWGHRGWRGRGVRGFRGRGVWRGRGWRGRRWGRWGWRRPRRFALGIGLWNAGYWNPGWRYYYGDRYWDWADSIDGWCPYHGVYHRCHRQRTPCANGYYPLVWESCPI